MIESLRQLFNDYVSERTTRSRESTLILIPILLFFFSISFQLLRSEGVELNDIPQSPPEAKRRSKLLIAGTKGQPPKKAEEDIDWLVLIGKTNEFTFS